jgi:tetratricopeptide (TPR) repeat protein
MKLPARIAVPVGFALICALGVIFLVWWQLRASSQGLLQPATGSGITMNDFAPSFAPAAAIDPKDRAVLHLREGDIFALKGNWAQAGNEYEQSVKNGGGLPALRKLAQAQLQRRDIDGVRSTIRALRAAGARSEDLLLLESIVALRTGELSQARDMLNAGSDSPQKHYGLALLAIVEGNHPLAQQELAQVIGGWEPVLRSYARSLQAAYDEFALFPESTELHLTTLLARSLAQVHECELALPLLSTVTRTQDDYRDAWIVQGYCELTTERADSAVASLEHAYNQDPSKPETQYFLARAYSMRSEYENAITFLEYALQNGFEPQGEIHRAIAQEAVKGGKNDLALANFAALLETPDVTVEDFAGFVAMALALGQNDNALEKAQKAVEKFPSSASAHAMLGSALAALERAEEARLSYQKALDIDPYMEEVKERLKELGK